MEDIVEVCTQGSEPSAGVEVTWCGMMLQIGNDGMAVYI